VLRRPLESTLSDVSVPWWITVGSAIDLAGGRRTRRHDDVDVMLLGRDEHAANDVDRYRLLLVTGPQN
jgi:hypothetical protein